MKALAVCGSIILILFLLSLVRVGGLFQYAENGLRIQVKVGPAKIAVYPPKSADQKKKHKKAKKEKPAAAKKEEEPFTKGRGGSVAALIKRFLPLIQETVGRLKRKIRIDQLFLDFVAASQDPAAAAMTFGGANAALGVIWPILEENFTIKERCIRTGVDFTAQEPVIHLTAQFTMTVGQGIQIAAVMGVKFLRQMMRYKKSAAQKREDMELQQKEAV